MESHTPDIPLCVDLDGTLLKADLPVEMVLALVRQNPLHLFSLPLWLARGGMARAKAETARRVPLDTETLPYNQPFLGWLKEQKADGRSLWLCTGSPRAVAEAVANHLGLFDGVVATEEAGPNLTGKSKAATLAARFGEKGFDYCGNEAKDMHVWQIARHAVVVNADAALEKRAATVATVAKVFPRVSSSGFPAALRALRPQQWAKNLLLFVPLLAAHRMADGESLRAIIIAFAAFCACASSVYLLNDMLDIEADRRHPHKAARPFAAGDMSLVCGMGLMLLLLAAAFALAQALPPGFAAVLGLYYIVTAFYSLWLKAVPIVDTLTLALLYTLRIVAGGAAAAVMLSFWLLLFSMFFFLSLAWVKRCAELAETSSARGYRPQDLPLLKAFGLCTGYISVLVLALYIDSPAVTALYSHPSRIWMLCLLLLYWLSRIWLKTHRGEMHHDPVVFALKDRVSYVVGALGLLTLLWAS